MGVEVGENEVIFVLGISGSLPLCMSLLSLPPTQGSGVGGGRSSEERGFL